MPPPKQLSCAAAALFLAALAGCSSPRFDVKFRDRNDQKVGDTAQVSSSNSFTLKTQYSIGGKVLKEEPKIDSLEQMDYKYTLLVVDADNHATSMRREYTRAQSRSKGQAKTLPYEGKSLLIEKKADGWRFQLEEGDELTGDDAAQVAHEFAAYDKVEEPVELLRPKKPVKVGESYELPIDKIASNYEKTTPVPLDTSKATGAGKLARVYKQDGHQFGVLEIQIEIPIKQGAKYGDDLVVEPGCKMTLKQTLDGCIDGSCSTSTFHSVLLLNITGLVAVPGKGSVKVTVIGEGTFDHKHQDLTH
jgi:hypothetical protein